MSEETTQPMQPMATPKRKFSIFKVLGILLQLVVIAYIFASGYFMYTMYQDLAKIKTTLYPKAAFADTDLPQLAKDIGLNVNDFKKCLDSGEVDSVISADQKNGQEIGIQGTPGSVLVNLKTNKAIRIDGGALPIDIMKTIVADFTSGKSIEEINAYMTSVQAGQVAEVTNMTPISKNDHQRGAKNPTFALVEYSDLQCPFCSRFHPTLQQLQAENPNDMLWVYRHFPLTSIHQYAQKFAEASECASQQKGNTAFWDVADHIFAAELPQ
ncbi:MAG TPA: thioredoxin domain-containing protein [Candidatus Saccharimonadales bacterium]|nr:thioredoxin domain-containing protein [Candidatus Saccharimonadales bacterium]